jgi:urease accessory protein
MQSPASQARAPFPGVFAIAFFAALPMRAEAHMTAPGMGDFISGVLHPWMTPTHLIILLALGLWLGQHVPLRLALPLKVFVPVSALALALTTCHWIVVVPPPILVAIAFAAATIVALDARLPGSAAAVLLGAAGLAIGLDSGVETGTPFTIFKTLLGTWVSLGIGLVNIGYYVSLATERKKKWVDIGVRVAASWIVAISLMMLAFALRKAHAG